MPFAEVYDPVADAWLEVAPMHLARVDHAAALLNDGRVLVTGGHVADAGYHPGDIDVTLRPGMESAEIWDPRTNSWSWAPPMAMRRMFHSATTLRDGRVLVVGGGESPSGHRADPAELWPPQRP